MPKKEICACRFPLRYHALMPILWSDEDWKVIKEPAFLPDGRKKEVSRVQRADSVHIMAFPRKDAILLLHEYRPYYGTHIWMLPSGKADKESNIEDAAQRELQEETGYRAGRLEHYCTTHHSESMMFANHLYLGYELTHDPLPQDADELIQVYDLPIEKALENILLSRYVHTASAYGILKYLRDAHGK